MAKQRKPHMITIEPIPGKPGINAEVDSFNLLVAALNDELPDILAIVSQQDGETTHKTLACILCWFVNLIRNVPTISDAVLDYYRRTVLSNEHDVWTERALADYNSGNS